MINVKVTLAQLFDKNLMNRYFYILILKSTFWNGVHFREIIITYILILSNVDNYHNKAVWKYLEADTWLTNLGEFIWVLIRKFQTCYYILVPIFCNWPRMIRTRVYGFRLYLHFVFRSSLTFSMSNIFNTFIINLHRNCRK